MRKRSRNPQRERWIRVGQFALESRHWVDEGDKLKPLIRIARHTEAKAITTRLQRLKSMTYCPIMSPRASSCSSWSVSKELMLLTGAAGKLYRQLPIRTKAKPKIRTTMLENQPHSDTSSTSNLSTSTACLSGSILAPSSGVTATGSSGCRNLISAIVLSFTLLK